MKANKPLRSAEFFTFPLYPMCSQLSLFFFFFPEVIFLDNCWSKVSYMILSSACPTISAIIKYRKLISEYTTHVHALYICRFAYSQLILGDFLSIC